MGIFNTGLNQIRDLHHDDVTEGICGTDGTAFAVTQTALQTPIAASEITLTKNKAAQSNAFRYRLDSTTATGNTFREFATRNTGNTDYDRSVFPGVAHTANDELVIIKTYFYKQQS